MNERTASAGAGPPRTVARALLLGLGLLGPYAGAQSWQEVQGRSKSGAIALDQALVDARADALALLVASHPDDRYVLPAVYLRYLHGVGVAVLLATRGGGGQNSLGPETGDALERIRTLETEAGCRRFDGAVWYLNRPDLGFRRTAAETFDEWGRDATQKELVRLLRLIRPDLVLTTHNVEEVHGHDQAVAELLPEAVALAADPAFATGQEPHRVRALFLGATGGGPGVVSIDSNRFEPVRGASLRRLAYDILLRHHLSPGAPGPMDSVFADVAAFAALPVQGRPLPTSLTGGLPSLFDADIWPGSAETAAALQASLASELPGLATKPLELIDHAVALIGRLQAVTCPPGSEAERRRARRLDALQRVVRHASGIAVEVEASPGAAAVPGEELRFKVRIHAGGGRGVDRVRVTSDAGEVLLEPVDGDSTRIDSGHTLLATVVYRVPLSNEPPEELMAARFRADRFVPPVHLQFLFATCGIELPVDVAVPVELRPPVELSVVPRMLLLPATREQVQFTVEVTRNSNFPVEGDLEVRAPAGYRVDGERKHVSLVDVRGDSFVFTVHAPPERKAGVDVVRIALGEDRVALPLHKVEVKVGALRIGVVRSHDDALLSVIGIGGFGLRYVELSDIDLAVGDLNEFDTIAIDVRALRDRPGARRSFRRLLDFCTQRGRRLVVFYHKDTEFEPPGEGFRGAPFAPFQIGRDRVTRADAPVTVLMPDHVLLNQPNTILPGDWDGWEQERALYLPGVYADAYEQILSMHDPGQPEERSALLYARTGAGEYVYCALALWRQWKKLHPGSVRLLANLLTPQPPAR